MPECFRCKKELPQYGYCDDCKDTCPICDGTGKAKGKVIQVDREIAWNDGHIPLPTFLKIMVEVLGEISQEGVNIHCLELGNFRGGIRIRAIGHKWIKEG